MLIDVDIIDETESWTGLPERAEVISIAIRNVEAECFSDGGAPSSVSVLLCDDAEIRQLNRDFRNIDKATNVLSFPSAASPGFPKHLGDLAIAFETVQFEARAEAKSLRDHTAHMVVHGMLHLLGYDHENSVDADRMEQLEVRILARFGVADPYSDTIPIMSSKSK